jgi:hypothetical protein
MRGEGREKKRTERKEPTGSGPTAPPLIGDDGHLGYRQR